MNPGCRFSIDDADCTSALHTSSGSQSDPPQTSSPPNGKGIFRPVAHYDFYVDGGLSPKRCDALLSLTIDTLTLAIGIIPQEPLNLIGLSNQVKYCQHRSAPDFGTISFEFGHCFKARRAMGSPDDCYKTRCPTSNRVTYYNYDVCSRQPLASSELYYIDTTPDRPFCSP